MRKLLLGGAGLIALMGYSHQSPAELECPTSDWGVNAHANFISELYLSDDSLYVQVTVPSNVQYSFSASPDKILHGDSAASLQSLEDRLRLGQDVVSLRGDMRDDGSFMLSRVYFNHDSDNAFALCNKK